MDRKLERLSRPVKVLNLTKSTGGLAQYNLQLYESINKSDFVIDFICLSDENVQFAEKMRQIGFNAIPLDMERYSINFWTDLKLIWVLRNIALQENYDVIVGHGSKAGFLARVIGRLVSKPAIYGLHTMSFLPRISGWKSYIYWFLEFIAARIGGHIVTLSHATEETLVNLKIAEKKQVTVIYTGVNTNYFGKRANCVKARLSLGLDPLRPVVGWAARFVPQKAPLEFIEAMAEVCHQIPEVQVFIAGVGPLQNQMETLIEQLGLESNFIIAPWQKNVRQMYSAFDIFILNSHWEGLPITLLEAMAMGVPTVATAVDGTGEVVNHARDGHLVQAGDIAKLAEYTIRLLNDKEMRVSIGQHAQERISTQFTLEQMRENWEQLFITLSRMNRSTVS